jgi:hypothetical protein
VLIPEFQNLASVGRQDPQDLGHLMRSIADVARDRDRLEPYLRATAAPVDVNVGRLMAVVADKIRPVPTPA